MMKEKSENLLDDADKEILELLKQNARMQWQEIGERVHLTGQGVKNRVDKLEKLGILRGYTADIDYKKYGYEMNVFIAVFMKTTRHQDFVKLIREESAISEAHRTGGESCYLLKAYVASSEELTRLLDAILEYGNYKVSLSLEKVK